MTPSSYPLLETFAESGWGVSQTRPTPSIQIRPNWIPAYAGMTKGLRKGLSKELAATDSAPTVLPQRFDERIVASGDVALELAGFPRK